MILWGLLLLASKMAGCLTSMAYHVCLSCSLAAQMQILAVSPAHCSKNMKDILLRLWSSCCRYSMTSMNVPDPVMSLALLPKSRDSGGKMSRALSRFLKEDPTFKVCLFMLLCVAWPCKEQVLCIPCSADHLLPRLGLGLHVVCSYI